MQGAFVMQRKEAGNMSLDISKIEYYAELITETGAKYDLNNVLYDLQWEEQTGELAQRATIKAANIDIDSTWLMAVAKINCLLRIYAKWDAEKTLVFDGTVWEWQYAHEGRKELTLTAYDRLIRLQQSQDFMYFSPGMATRDLIGGICKDWGIPLSYKWNQSMTHGKKVFSGNAVSDMIFSTLDEVQSKTGEKYTAYFRDNMLQIVNRGTNNPVYKFDWYNTQSSNDKMTINNLVTEVKIIGRQDNEERAPIEDTVSGDTSYGLLRAILRRDDDKTLAETQAEAKTILKERGKPEEQIQVTVPDLPFLRKGDKIEMEAANLRGFFYAAGVSHRAAQKLMTLTLEREV
jgi:hypothetical protein